MKMSLKKQMILFFVALVFVIVAFLALSNTIFLRRYYVFSKQKTLVNAYEKMNEIIAEEDLGSVDDTQTLTNYSDTVSGDEFDLKMDQLFSSSNISIFCMNASGNTLFCSTPDEGILKSRLLHYALTDESGGELANQEEEAVFFDQTKRMHPGEDGEMMPPPEDIQKSQNSTVLKKNDNYQILRVVDERFGSQYLEMWGNLQDDMGSFLMRIPMESIQESVSISNRFLVYVLLLAILIGALIAWGLGSQIASPIKELASLSSRMAKLDFDVHYESGGNNEIGILGENFNRMSDALHDTISQLKEANAQLQSDIEKMEKVNTMQKEFIANVSHELKTPIALIQGYAEGLEDEINSDPESRAYYCDVIRDEAARMNTLVRQLLDLSALEQPFAEHEMEPFDLSDLIHGMCRSMQILKEQHGVSLIDEVDEHFEAIGDVFQIEQVVTNYLSNAIIHADDAKEVTVRAKRQGEKILVEVHNTGKQIAQEDLDRIWDKFYKVDRSHTREYGGSGIGLSIVKAIMEAHKGEYGARNDADGVTFYFALQCAM